MASKMVCSVCAGTTFDFCEYQAPGGSFPALECTKCRAITLDEALARTAEERDSVREMVAERARIFREARPPEG